MEYQQLQPIKLMLIMLQHHNSEGKQIPSTLLILCILLHLSHVFDYWRLITAITVYVLTGQPIIYSHIILVKIKQIENIQKIITLINRTAWTILSQLIHIYRYVYMLKTDVARCMTLLLQKTTTTYLSQTLQLPTD